MNRIAARLERRRLAFRRPVRTAHAEFTARDTLLLELRDSAGVRGLGEAAPWPGFGGDDLEATEHALRAAVQALGEFGDPVSGSPLPDEILAPLEAHPAARAALEGALCDLASRRAGVPLAAWLAAHLESGRRAAHERVASGALLFGRTLDEVRTGALQARAGGFAAAKLKLGAEAWAVDLERARAARAALGPAVRLRCDANGAWSRDEAGVALRALAALDVEYVEQPVAADDLEGLAALRRCTTVGVAADESVAAPAGLQAVIERRAADVVVLKPSLLGGPLRALELARRARSAGLDVVFTHALDGAVGAWQAVHCAAAWADPGAVHGLGTAGLLAQDAGPPVPVELGCVTLRAAPGLGFETWN